MNETNSASIESNNHSDDWKSWPPELFLANLLHEIRTPVMIIKGYAKFLSAEKTTEHFPEALESISKSVERLEKACEDIAEYRKALENRPGT
jgi:signal transduction histidine kinase